MATLILVYILSIIGNILFIRHFTKTGEFVEPLDIDDHIFGTVLLAPALFAYYTVIYLIISGHKICYRLTHRKTMEKETIASYNARLPEIWTKLDRLIKSSKPSELDNAAEFDSLYDKFIEGQNFSPKDKNEDVKVVTLNDVSENYLHMMKRARQAQDYARNKKKVVITAWQKSKKKPKETAISKICRQLANDYSNRI